MPPRGGNEDVASRKERDLLGGLNLNFGAALRAVGAAMGAGGVAGYSRAALRALAHLGGFPRLSGQTGALLHLRGSAFGSCHNL